MKGKLLSHVRLLATPWTAAHQAPLSMGFSRGEYWSGCHCLLHASYYSIRNSWVWWKSGMVGAVINHAYTLLQNRFLLFLVREFFIP